jgi:hypothetical protein
MPPTGVANFVVGGGANPDKPPPRGASMEFARDGGRTRDIVKVCGDSLLMTGVCSRRALWPGDEPAEECRNAVAQACEALDVSV